MRSRHLNFTLAIAASALVHVLLWPAAERIIIPQMGGVNRIGGSGQITLLLNDTPDRPEVKPKVIPPPPQPDPPVIPPPPKPPVVAPPDEMGEANAKGTGAQAAKGKELLRAPEADQDQAFLSRDPVGSGRIGDPPTFFTGPRGQNGSGGQVGGSMSQEAPAHALSPAERRPSEQAADDAKAANDHPENRPPRESLVHLPEPEVPSVTPPKDVAPPPSKTASIGAAPADVNQPPLDQVKPKGPLAQVASVSEGELQLTPEEGPTTQPVKPSSTAPPTKPDAPAERMAVALAPQLQIPKAAVLTPPPPAVDVDLPKPKLKDTPPPKPASAPAPVAPAMVTTGDGRAPGQDRAAADPAQESDSESDAFAKKLVSAVLHDGRLEVQNGRKIKTTRPHFLPGAEGAFLSNPNPILVLKVAIDETGKVTHVDFIRQTGSIEIDQPCRVAMFDWWFEPTHDKQGRPVPDVLPFEIRFR